MRHVVQKEPEAYSQADVVAMYVRGNGDRTRWWHFNAQSCAAIVVACLRRFAIIRWHRYKEGTDMSAGKDVFSSKAFVHVCLFHGVVPDAVDPPDSPGEPGAGPHGHPRASSDIEQELWVLANAQRDQI